jgi:hypothetical protein
LLCKKIVAKSKEVKTGLYTNLAESSKEGYSSKRAVLPMMVVMTTMGMVLFRTMTHRE